VVADNPPPGWRSGDLQWEVRRLASAVAGLEARVSDLERSREAVKRFRAAMAIAIVTVALTSLSAILLALIKPG
jgi:hypothetical protein